MNYDFIYSFSRRVVFTKSENIENHGIQMNTKELRCKGKKYDYFRKVSKLKTHNPIKQVTRYIGLKDNGFAGN